MTAINKFEGIITPEVLEKVNKESPTLDREYRAFFQWLQSFEPHLIEDVRVRGNEAKDHFRRLGITGKNLDEVADAVKTFYIRGIMVHRHAISVYDAKKIQEIYGEDYDAYLDKLIDEGLKNQGPKKEVESIEPEKVAPKDLDDLI